MGSLKANHGLDSYRCIGQHCLGKGDIVWLRQHMEESHPECVRKSPELSFAMFDFEAREVDMHTMRFVTCPLGDFFVTVEYVAKKETFYGAVIFVGPRDSIDGFQSIFYLQMRDSSGKVLKKRYENSTSLFPFGLKYFDIYKKDECFQVTKSVTAPFSYRDHLRLYLTIHGSKNISYPLLCFSKKCKDLTGDTNWLRNHVKRYHSGNIVSKPEVEIYMRDMKERLEDLHFMKFVTCSLGDFYVAVDYVYNIKKFYGTVISLNSVHSVSDFQASFSVHGQEKQFVPIFPSYMTYDQIYEGYECFLLEKSLVANVDNLKISIVIEMNNPVKANIQNGHL